MLVLNDEVNILNTSSVMTIFILLLLLTNLDLILLSTQGIYTNKLLSTQRTLDLLLPSDTKRRKKIVHIFF